MREGEESELPLHNRPMISAALLKQSSSNSVCMWRGSPLSTPLSPETKVRTEACVVTTAMRSTSPAKRTCHPCTSINSQSGPLA